MICQYQMGDLERIRVKMTKRDHLKQGIIINKVEEINGELNLKKYRNKVTRGDKSADENE